MNKILRTSLLSLTTLLLLIIIGWFYTNFTIKNKITYFLENRLPNHINLQYDDLTLNIFEGTVHCLNPKVLIGNKMDTIIHTRVLAEKFILEDVSYWDYVLKDKITIEDIKIQSAKIEYYIDKFHPEGSINERTPLVQLYKDLIVEELSVDNAQLKIYNGKKDPLLFSGDALTLEIDDILINQKTLTQKIPFKYSGYNAEGSQIFLQAGPYENLTLSHFLIEKNRAQLDTINLKTKYSRHQLSQTTPNERDHYNLKVDQVNIEALNFGFIEAKFFGSSRQINMKNPSLDIYRDKLVADDLSEKSLYSKMIRDIPFDLTIDTLSIKDGSISYNERIKKENNGGAITFKKISTEIVNLSNTYEIGIKTEINISAIFMKTTPIKVGWGFDVNDQTDKFLLKGEVGKLPSADLNPFTEPNLNVKLTGMTDKLYFTVDGNNSRSTIDMRMKYENFKIELMQKKGIGINKLLSKVANIFIRNNSKSDEGAFTEGSVTVQRDTTKSFFNYLWLNLRNGLLKTLS
ncbi:hypothetical protein [Dokdonia sinensis]|nr:hypothetical protein [Dokdonia sinensis]